eukprot:TRINITY_DN3509_c0_g1_i1.p1 TRINITY_DN3509_c0_g1~~TRINITY_DN3509_c0_g1_i1.p1  ORF type:complete len:292 (-),score=93.25 TRINITY_DN3509_c0_g1_i1:366-1241(-)
MLESVPKPCLKPQSSYASDESDASSSYGSGSSAAENAVMAYRKSVSFADSIGGDLCHIRTFAKGINDAFMFEDDWWKDCALNPWGDDEEDEEDIQDLDLLDYCSEYYEYLDDDDDEESDELYLLSPSKELHSATPLGFAQELQSEESEVARTFVAPGDLPEFDKLLRERLFCVEDVHLTNNSDNVSGGMRFSGFLQLQTPLKEPLQLSLPFSVDGWDSTRVLETLSTPGDCGLRHAFKAEAKDLDLRVGDDLELQVQGTLGNTTVTDDNASHNYRFICKKKAKFQPGRSLW